MPRHDIVGGSAAAHITGTINATDLTITIDTTTNWPVGTNGKFYVTIDRGLPTEEQILVTSRSAGTLTVANTGDRGVSGTTAQSHSSGAPIEVTYAAQLAEDADAHVWDPTRDDHTQYLPAASAAGNGLSVASRVLAVNTDNSTIEINADTLRVKDTGISTAKIADSSITSAKIADGTIGTNDIANDAITSAKILDGTIATADIADNAITTNKILDGTIVAGDIASSVWAQVRDTGSAACNSALTVAAVGAPAATPDTVAGTTITFTPTRVGQIYFVYGTADITYTAGFSHNPVVVALSIDNSNSLTNPQIIAQLAQSGQTFRTTLGQGWFYTAVDTSTHTFRLKAYKAASDDTAVINNLHTVLNYVRLG